MSDLIIKGTYDNPKQYGQAFYIVRIAERAGVELSADDEAYLVKVLCKVITDRVTAKKRGSVEQDKQILDSFKDMAEKVARGEMEINDLKAEFEPYIENRQLNSHPNKKTVEQALNGVIAKYGLDAVKAAMKNM